MECLNSPEHCDEALDSFFCCDATTIDESLFTAAKLRWTGQAGEHTDCDTEQWVPVTPQTMRTIETPRPGQVGLPIPPMMPPQQMKVYALQLS